MISFEAIVAMNRNRLIGVENRLPWPTMKADMAHFRRMTMNRIVIMGRKTAESLPGPLGGRHLIAISRSAKRIPCVQEVADSFEGAIMAAIRESTRRRGDPDAGMVMIAGGAAIYQAAIDAKILSAVNLTLIPGRWVNRSVPDHELRFMPRFEDDFVTLDVDFEVNPVAEHELARAHAEAQSLGEDLRFIRFVRKTNRTEKQLKKPPDRQPDMGTPDRPQPRI